MGVKDGLEDEMSVVEQRAGGRGYRARGLLAVGLASIEASLSGRTEHRPTSADYPDSVVRRTTIVAGGGLGWKISALITPRNRPAPWRIVVITGAPSWAEYWAPILAALPPDREMIVVDRPGYGASEPAGCVPDIRVQALALAPLLRAAPGQRILLVGQSYGAAIATLMAAAQPGDVAGLILLSSYLGEAGPTARWLIELGSRFKGVIPRDLRHGVIEAAGHAGQMPHMLGALARYKGPVHVIHGERDDFAPLANARRLAMEARAAAPLRFESLPDGDHFLTDAPPETVICLLESCIPATRSAFASLQAAWARLQHAWTLLAKPRASALSIGADLNGPASA
jgi:pimeloyl-ACP methyl ester carboxylesterase